MERKTLLLLVFHVLIFMLIHVWQVSLRHQCSEAALKCFQSFLLPATLKSGSASIASKVQKCQSILQPFLLVLFDAILFDLVLLG